MISWFLLVPAQGPRLVSLLSFLFFLFPGKGCFSTMISWFLLVLAWVGLVSLFFFSLDRDFVAF